MNPLNPPAHTVIQECDTAVALEAGRQLGAAKANPMRDGMPYAVLKDAQGRERIEYLDEGQQRQPHRLYGTVKLADEESFCAYFTQFGEPANIYASLDPARFVAVFNDHKKEMPGFRDHRAVLTLAHSREWEAWKSMDGKKFDGNVAFAEWLEDQAPDMVKPSGADMMQLALNFRVAEKIAFANPTRLQDGQTELTYSQIVEGSSQSAKGGKVKIPETFTIEIPIFAGLNAVRHAIEARFRYRLVGGVLSIWYDLVRPHKAVEEAFRAVWDYIQDETQTTILHGSPE